LISYRTFDHLLLPEPILAGLKKCGFVRPSPIQLAALPAVKIGLDAIVQVKTCKLLSSPYAKAFSQD